MTDGYKQLAIAIILRSVEDYQYLNRINETRYHYDEGGTISKSEIRKFLLSEYCDFLLQNMAITGKDILKYLESV